LSIVLTDTGTKDSLLAGPISALPIARQIGCESTGASSHKVSLKCKTLVLAPLLAKWQKSREMVAAFYSILLWFNYS
jgi:hypothetical protein